MITATSPKQLNRADNIHAKLDCLNVDDFCFYKRNSTARPLASAHNVRAMLSCLAVTASLVQLGIEVLAVWFQIARPTLPHATFASASNDTNHSRRPEFT